MDGYPDIPERPRDFGIFRQTLESKIEAADSLILDPGRRWNTITLQTKR
jgi:hypothetical protein